MMMLLDNERKTLLVLFHFSSNYRRMPTWDELQRLTSRRKWVLEKAVRVLQEKRAIEWDGQNLWSIKLDPRWDLLI
jgi:hypothetical protein